MISLQSVILNLQNIKPELARRFHVQEIGIFGSLTRNDFSDKSDVDIVVSFNGSIGIEFIDLADFIEKSIHHKVDLISRNAMSERFYSAIKNEIQYV
ncbi:MAG: nucleotidyltransferase family protein [Chitinophagaceae bacterium]|nr:DNA polymerase subunit beta [Chitinophagaceae bacterium]